MPRNNPITDTNRVLNASSLTQTPVADGQAVTGGKSPAAGATVNTLLVYDKNDSEIADFAPHLSRAYYPNAKLAGVDSLASLVSELSKYSEIGTLVIDTHSIRGSMLLGGRSHKASQVQAELAKSGTRVTSEIVFEGCSIMRDPINTCKMVAKICGPNTQVVGYSYYTIVQLVDFDFTGVTDPAVIEAQYNDFEPHYWLPGLPSPQDAVDTRFQHGRRWFRDQLDSTLPEGQNFRRIESRGSLGQRSISSRAEAKQAVQDYSGPVISKADVVTVTNIAAVAGTTSKATAPATP